MTGAGAARHLYDIVAYIARTRQKWQTLCENELKFDVLAISPLVLLKVTLPLQ